MARSMSALRVRGLSKSYGGVRALHDVSFSVEAGELVALIGANGAGKTTCFNILGGQLRPDAGSAELRGESLVGLAPRHIWRLGVGRTFQIAQTFGSMSVRENVQVALTSACRKLHAPFGRLAGQAQAEALLQRVGMLDQAERPCAQLAYGDLKRVELALALSNAPRLLLMDEPTAGMAPGERGALMLLASTLARAENIAVLFTEHDMEVVFGHADRVLVLHDGELIASGTPDEVRRAPRVQETYLGTA
jgi:branched-chain amino acid transport system ATP-binding protein